MAINNLLVHALQEEMNVLSSLKHPNIIRLIEVHFTNNVFFLIMCVLSDDRGCTCNGRQTLEAPAQPVCMCVLPGRTHIALRPVM
eukprot:478009-Pelagomonas_calceolata.AAC.1